MRKGLLSIALAAVMVAGVFSALPAGAQEADPPIAKDGPATTYFLHRAACGGDADPGLGMSTEDLQEEGGDDCGNLLMGLPNEAELVTTIYPATDALPLTLDPSRPVSGEITLHSNGVGAGQAEVDLTLTGTSGGETVVIAEQTLTYVMTPDSDTYTSPIEMIPDEGSNGKVFESLEFTTWVRGPSLLHGYASVDDPPSFVVVPTSTRAGDGTIGDDVVKEKKLTKKQQCKKIQNKNKRKRCLKKLKAQSKPPTRSCPAYEPGEQGAEAELLTVTDKHTEEAPLEATVAHDVGLTSFTFQGQGYDEASHFPLNLQMDSKDPEMGLHVRYEFPDHEDHDLYVYYADGAQAARVAGGNQLALDPSLEEGTGNGGHSEVGAEVLDGLRTADCAGYTLDLVNWLGEGGDYTVKFWLGEIQNDPAPPASARAALELMQGILG